MADLFNWSHQAEPGGTITFKVRKAQFGDGYSQAVPDGINNKSDSWPLTFFGTGADVQPIVAFLDAHAGASSFLWTPPMPNGVQGLYRCNQYQLTPFGDDWYTLQATFEQAFAP